MFYVQRVSVYPEHKSGDEFEKGSYTLTFMGRDSGGLTVSATLQFEVKGK